MKYSALIKLVGQPLMGTTYAESLETEEEATSWATSLFDCNPIIETIWLYRDGEAEAFFTVKEPEVEAPYGWDVIDV